MSAGRAAGLAVDNAVVLNNSNRLILRLLPCDVVARVAASTHPFSTENELAVVEKLAEAGSPVAPLEPRVAPRVFAADGFKVTFWAQLDPVAQPVSPAAYTDGLVRLHAGLGEITIPTSHVMDRIAETEEWVVDHAVTPDLSDEDRALLVNTLRDLRDAIARRRAVEQLLHGEPHPANLLNTNDGPLFIDFENTTYGPVEYDLAWVPEEVAARYPGADAALLDECRGLVLAIIAVSHSRADDQHPGNTRTAEWIKAVRAGPPWQTLDTV